MLEHLLGVTLNNATFHQPCQIFNYFMKLKRYNLRTDSWVLFIADQISFSTITLLPSFTAQYLPLVPYELHPYFTPFRRLPIYRGNVLLFSIECVGYHSSS